jgi:hypothetical protein
MPDSRNPKIRNRPPHVIAQSPAGMDAAAFPRSNVRFREPHMTTPWQPFREPLHHTLLRNGIIALAISAIIAWRWGGRWPVAFLVALWPTFGGHLLELLFLNALRPRLPAARAAHLAARLTLWFLGGIALSVLMAATLQALTGSARWIPWWAAGLGFVAIELLVHAVMQLRRLPNFYNGRG